MLVCFFQLPVSVSSSFQCCWSNQLNFCLPSSYIIFIANNTLRGVGVFLLPEVFVGWKVSKLDPPTNLNPFMHSDWWLIGWCLWCTHIISNGSSGGLFGLFVYSTLSSQDQTSRKRPRDPTPLILNGTYERISWWGMGRESPWKYIPWRTLLVLDFSFVNVKLLHAMGLLFTNLVNKMTRWWFHFFFHPYLGKIPNLTNIFERGWFNHQLG